MKRVPVLSRQVELQERVLTGDGAGGYAKSWTTLGTLWAAFDARSGSERVIGGRTTSGVTYRVTVRAAPHGAPSRPRPEQRFLDGDRVFSILAVADEDPEGLYLTCWTEEGTRE